MVHSTGGSFCSNPCSSMWSFLQSFLHQALMYLPHFRYRSVGISNCDLCRSGQRFGFCMASFHGSGPFQIHPNVQHFLGGQCRCDNPCEVTAPHTFAFTFTRAHTMTPQLSYTTVSSPTHPATVQRRSLLLRYRLHLLTTFKRLTSSFSANSAMNKFRRIQGDSYCRLCCHGSAKLSRTQAS